MFREMRRKKQQLSKAETIAILISGTSGTLALAGDNGYPYAVPISYVYDADKLYFHLAKAGHKLDAILRNDKASFCVIQQDQVIPETFKTHFRSAIIFGRIRLLEDDKQKREALTLIARKYSPGLEREGQEEIDRNWARLNVAEL